MCLDPIRIKNQYTNEYMFVPCNHCDECKIDKACTNIANLSNYMQEYKNALFVTLTYDNEHIPYVQNGSPYIYRGSNFPPAIVDKLDDVVPAHDTLPITGFPSNSPFTGVLYYRDIQLFLKRLRINYERNYGKRADFKYFCLGEYGTTTYRPHYHILFLSDDEFGKGFRNEIVSNWEMCDWDKLDASEVIKDATTGIASYLSAYMCGYTLQHGVLSFKMFRQKVCRSKDIRFSADKEIRKNIETFQRCHGYIDKDKGIDGNPFGRCDKSKLGCVSYVVVSARFFNSLYPKPKGFSQIDYCDKLRFLTEILRANSKRPIKPVDCSQDYKYCLAYRRYLKRNGFEDDSIHQILFAQELMLANDMRESLNLKLEMKEFEEMDYSEYVVNIKSNSYVEDLEKRDLRLRCLLSKDFVFDYVQRPRSSRADSLYKAKFLKYKHYLLPKHFNSYYGFNL